MKYMGHDYPRGTVHDLWLWKFEPELEENSEIKCPDCNEWNIWTNWRETSVYCETCGDHATLECPNCKNDFDHVGAKTFETRIKEII